MRGRPPAPGYGHVALTASGGWQSTRRTPPGSPTAASDDGPPGERPQYGPGYYAAYLRDPDGLRVEVVSTEITDSLL